MRIFAVLCGVLCVFLSNPFHVFAESVEKNENASRWYVSGSGVAIFPFTSETNTYGDVDLNFGAGGVGAIGIEIPFSDGSKFFYGEIEGGFRQSKEKDGFGKVQTTTMLANVGLKVAGTPESKFYASVGAGVGMHNITEQRPILNPGYPGQGPSVRNFKETYDDTTIAFQALVGLEHMWTDSFSSKVGYRLFATSEFEDRGFTATYLTHGIDAGFAYYF